MHLMRLRFTLCLLLGLAGALSVGSRTAHASAGDLFVTSDASNLMRTYSGGSGAFAGVVWSSSTPTGQMAVHFGATNNRVLLHDRNTAFHVVRGERPQADKRTELRGCQFNMNERTRRFAVSAVLQGT